MEEEIARIKALPSSKQLSKNICSYLQTRHSFFKIIHLNFHKNLLSPIRDQKETYSCAYVATVTCVEMLYRKSNIKVLPNSDKEYFDIDDFFENHYKMKKFLDPVKANDPIGELGTSMTDALSYVKSYGLLVTSICRSPRIKNAYSCFCKKMKRAKISSFTELGHDLAFKYARDTPMIGVLIVYDSFVSCQTVMYEGPFDSDKKSYVHSVVIVGNATVKIEKKIKKFFIVQNSYGDSFGYEGFMLISINKFDEFWLPEVPRP